MFSKDNFSEILKKINSTYSNMTLFSEKANLDRTYLSKYINKKLDNPPSPKILEKIASASNGIISYEQLMSICGYFKNSSKNYFVDIKGLDENDIEELNRFVEFLKNKKRKS